jgi:phosphate transport system substrate-binding protein
MSRDLRYCTGLDRTTNKSKRVALNAVAVWKNPSAHTTYTNIASPAAAGQLFCGPSLNGTGCPTTWHTLDGTTNPLQLIRLDDGSGAPEAFKQLTGCTAFCPNVLVMTYDYTNDQPTINGSLPPECHQYYDSTTTCLGMIAAARHDTMVFAGLNVGSVSPAPLALKNSGIAPSTTTVQNFDKGVSGAYPLSHYLYINNNPTHIAVLPNTSAEKRFWNWMFVSHATMFENELTDSDDGFIKCAHTVGPFGCNTAGEACP